MFGVVAETAERHARFDRLGFRWNQGNNAALLERTVDLRVGIASISGDRFDGDAGGGFDFHHLRPDHVAFIRLSSRDLNVENDAELVIDSRMLFVSRLQSPVASAGRHCRVRIGRAHLLVFAGLTAFPLGFNVIFALALAQPIYDMTLNQAIPADMAADERRIDVYHFGRGNLCLQAGCDRALEDLSESIFAPALADSRQA